MSSEARLGNGSRGDAEIAGRTLLSGLHTGSVTVQDGGQLRIIGDLRGPLNVEDGGLADVVGAVSDTVTVRSGGTLVVRGQATVNGHLFAHDGALVTKESGAIVSGRRTT